MTDIENLMVELEKITYPSSLQKVNCGIKGIGFFPGARGLWVDGDVSISNKKIMVLGHDFGTVVDYEKSENTGKESENSATWRNLLLMLKSFDIQKEECFFTNAIMGLRKVPPITGTNPAYPNYLKKLRELSKGINNTEPNPNYDFMQQCKDFLITQIEIQKPKLIIVLGNERLELLGEITNSLQKIREQKIKKFTDIDANELACLKHITIKGIENFKTNIAIITHPSLYFANVHRREFNGEKNANAEIRMIKELLYE